MEKGGGHLCRDCLATGPLPAPERCRRCRSPRILAHAELFDLAIAHIDCDAFFASVEKRDDPSLASRPLIVGGGVRGVVATCCYIARMSGVRSAMPMFRARKLCPDAVVIKPDMAKYVAVSRQIRAQMDALTPLVQPISIDEAFLDLSGTQSLHKAPPALVLARLAQRVEATVGVTLSVGLSHNKLLAKIASDLDKPRGFAVIGAAETAAFLADKPITLIHGVGNALATSLAREGITTIGDVQRRAPEEMMRHFGETGARLARLARGEDTRKVSVARETKSVSSETTFNTDLTDYDSLSSALLSLCERLSDRMKAQGLVGDTVTLKLKTAGFRTRTRAQHLMLPTQLAHTLYAVGQNLLAREVDGTAFRLLGIGLSGLSQATGQDPVDLIEPALARNSAAERAMDAVRGKFGKDALVRGKLYRAGKNRDIRPDTIKEQPDDLDRHDTD